MLRWTVPASGAECECNTCENGWCTLLACADPCRAPRERAHLSLDQAISHANSLAMVCTEEIQREVDENSSSTWNTAHVCRPGDVQDVTIVKTYSVEIPLKRTAETETVEREKSVRFEVAP